MTSHDVRDMLDLPGSAAPRPAKKQKIAGPRPNLKGLAREVQSLGGDNPIAIVPEMSLFKKRRLASRKPAAKWELKPFQNSARADDLVLRHWRRKADAAPTPASENIKEEKPEDELDDSTFAKFNVKVNTPKYDDDQYKLKLENDDWSRDETDYLMGLVEEYDLRWPVIWDRYEYEPPVPELDVTEGSIAIVPATKVRTMEDMKARYYNVAAKMMAVHNPIQFMGQTEFNLHELMMNFDPKQETSRKRFAEAAFNRTRDEAKEEESLLLELKRILARSEKLGEERRELYSRLEAPPSTGNIGLYTSSQGLQQLLQQLMTVDKTKKRKSLMGIESMSPANGGSGNQQQASSSYDRRDNNNRESVSGPSTQNNKKGPQNGAGNERRKLTEEEEHIYGVTHHDRLTGGPNFRHEKINRPINSKSTVQQQKISNVLTELEIPGRLIMPTADVGLQFEQLLAAINTLLDSRKVADKLAGEIQLARAQKELKEEKEKEKEKEREKEGTDGVSNGEVKVEEEREKSAAPSIKGGSVHKRSASVLSTVSDKSTKRQKK